MKTNKGDANVKIVTIKKSKSSGVHFILRSIFIFGCFFTTQVHAQNKNSEQLALQKIAPNLIIITTDGLRWQEVFGGVDTSIANQNKFNHGDSAYIAKKYGATNADERKKKLLPFLFSNTSLQNNSNSNVINNGNGKSIIVFGDRNTNNKAAVENPHWFSYPGYNELLTGYADPAINSNDYKPNPHSNLFAFLNKQNAYQGKVAAFGAWDAFDRILNEKVSGFPVINAFETITQVLSDPTSKMLGNLLTDSYKPFKEVECLDVFTHYQAMHYLKTKQPKAMFISYGETDEWAHHGNYSNYLDAANMVDKWIGDIWNWVQAMPGYKDNTYILLTTDHGRGFGSAWTDHGADVNGANATWFAIIGPPALNSNAKELFGKPLITNAQTNTIYQKQLAATMAKLLGIEFTANHPIGNPIY